MISLLTLLQKSYATGWLVAAPIGPVNLEIIRRGLRDRLLSGFLVGLGACCVDATYLSVFSLGLGAVLRVGGVHTAAFIVGGTVLCWIGVGALRDARTYWRRRAEPPGAMGSRKSSDATDMSDQSDMSDKSDRSDEAEAANSAKSEEPGESAEAADLAKPARSGESAFRRFSRRPLGSYLVGIGMTATNPMTIAFWSALALEFANLPVAHRLVATAGVLAGTMSWVVLLTALLGFARRWVGPQLFACVTLAGGTVVLFFGVRFLWRGLAIEHCLARWLS